MIGYAFVLPVGAFALIRAPAAPAQMVLGMIVIDTAILMLRGFPLTRCVGQHNNWRRIRRA
jgi:uncharacterized protein